MNEKKKKIEFRCTEYEFNRIAWLANTYAEGNVSKWVRNASLEMPRTFLKKPKKKRKR